MDYLFKVAAILYDSEDNIPAYYFFDPETGERRPNPYLDREQWRQYLNRMTIAGFKRLVRGLPYELIHFRRIGFGGKTFALARSLRGLSQVGGLDEFFIIADFCVLCNGTPKGISPADASGIKCARGGSPSLQSMPRFKP